MYGTSLLHPQTKLIPGLGSCSCTESARVICESAAATAQCQVACQRKERNKNRQRLNVATCLSEAFSLSVWHSFLPHYSIKYYCHLMFPACEFASGIEARLSMLSSDVIPLSRCDKRKNSGIRIMHGENLITLFQLKIHFY